LDKPASAHLTTIWCNPQASTHLNAVLHATSYTSIR
jgi:hypothetical protein